MMEIKTMVEKVWMAKRYKGTPRLSERCCRDIKGHQGLATVLVPRVTRLIFTWTCHTQQRLIFTLNKEADSGIHQLSPEGLPGLMLLNSSSLQILKWGQGQGFPFWKATWELAPSSRWHSTCRLEMFKKRFLLCHQEKHRPSFETPPTFSPCLNGIWCVCFPQVTHDWSRAQSVLLVATRSGQMSMGLMTSVSLLVSLAMPQKPSSSPTDLLLSQPAVGDSPGPAECHFENKNDSFPHGTLQFIKISLCLYFISPP